MTDRRPVNPLLKSLSAYGSDLSRWPGDRAGAAREALLGRPDFRRAWEQERVVDDAIDAARREIDAEVARAGSLQRVQGHVMARISADPLAGLSWTRVAAAVLVASMLGGAVDLVLLPERPAEPSEAIALDPLLGVDDAGRR